VNTAKTWTREKEEERGVERELVKFVAHAGECGRLTLDENRRGRIS